MRRPAVSSRVVPKKSTTAPAKGEPARFSDNRLGVDRHLVRQFDHTYILATTNGRNTCNLGPGRDFRRIVGIIRSHSEHHVRQQRRKLRNLGHQAMTQVAHRRIGRKIEFDHRTACQLFGDGEHLHRSFSAGCCHETINSWPRLVSKLATSGIKP